jgi:hypothetical protein
VAPEEEHVFGEQLGPGRSSRAMAIVHIAMFDAINAIVGGYKSYSGIAFTFISDEFNGVTKDNQGNIRPLVSRSFSSLSQAEKENGQSRIISAFTGRSINKRNRARKEGRPQHLQKRISTPITWHVCVFAFVLKPSVL